MSKNKISGKVLAIQLGSKETQIVLMGNHADILHSVSLATPAGAVEDGMIWNEDAVRDMLKEALKEPEFKHVRQVVFSLCTSQVISDTITTPDLPAAKLAKLIEANADMYFPVDTHDYKMVWQVVGPKNNGLKEVEVQLWAVPTNMIARYYHVANECGLSVQAIDYCGHSAAAAIGATFAKPGKSGKTHKKLDLNKEISFGKKKAEPALEEETDEPEIHHVMDTDLHLLLERDLLGMTFVQAGQVVFQRFIRCGNDPAYQFSEIAMMVEYFRTMEIGRGSSISGIVSGYFADNIQMVDELGDVLGMPLLKLQTAYDPKWTMCVGAVQTTLDFGDPSLNKVKTAASQMRGHLWQYGLILAGALAVLLVTMLLLTSRLTWDTEISSLESQQQMLQVQAQKTAGFADNYYEYENLYNAYDQDWNTIFASLYAYNDNLAQVMDELEKIIPETASVTNMQISHKGLNVEFACETKEDAAYLIMALRNMKYIDRENLVVSDLTGGGSGPATSYGTGESAPTKGSGTVDASALVDAIAADLSDPYEVGYYLGLGKDIKVELLDDLMVAYGITPDSVYTSLEEVDADFDTRAAAFREMCTTNPYAMYMAEQLIMENQDSELSLLLQEEDIFWDNAVGWKNHKSVDDLEEDLDGLLDLLLTDEMVMAEAKFGATEALIAEEPDALLWYLYYLDAQINGDGSAPYMDMDAAAYGLVNDRNDDGSLNVLNAQIYSKVLSESTKKALKPEDYVGAALKSYLAAGNAGDTQMQNYIEGYLGIRTSGDEFVDKAIVAALDNGGVDTEIAALVAKSYGEEGATGIAVVDALFTKAKSENNVTGIEAFDTAIAAYLQNQSGGEGGGNEGENPDDNTGAGEGGGNEGGGNEGGGDTPGGETPTYEQKLIAYITTGDAGDIETNLQLGTALANGEANPYLEDFVERYHVEGTTGNDALNNKIKAYEENGTSTGFEKFDEVIDAYNAAGGDGNEGGEDDGTGDEDDTVIWGDITQKDLENFLANGTTDDDVKDSQINAALESGMADGYLKNFVKKYFTTGDSGNDVLNGKIKNYYENKVSTGIPRLDAIIDANKPEDGEGEGDDDGSEGGSDDGFTMEDVEEYAPLLLKWYLTTGTVKGLPNIPEEYVATVDKALAGYFLEGDSGYDVVDEALDKAINAGAVDTELNKLIDIFYRNGKTNHLVIDALLGPVMQNPFNGGTGIEHLDKLLTQYAKKEIDKIAELEAALKKANEKAKEESKKDASGGNSKEKQDDRYRFTATLGYTDELREAELKRKGLSKDDKIAPLEVGE